MAGGVELVLSTPERLATQRQEVVVVGRWRGGGGVGQQTDNKGLIQGSITPFQHNSPDPNQPTSNPSALDPWEQRGRSGGKMGGVREKKGRADGGGGGDPGG